MSVDWIFILFGCKCLETVYFCL